MSLSLILILNLILIHMNNPSCLSILELNHLEQHNAPTSEYQSNDSVTRRNFVLSRNGMLVQAHSHSKNECCIETIVYLMTIRRYHRPM